MELEKIMKKDFLNAIYILITGLLLVVLMAIRSHAEEPKMIINGQYVIDITEAPPINDVSSALDAQDATIAASTVYGDISLTAEDFDLLRRIMALEGHTEGHEGLKGIAEVVFNRMRSDRFPNTLSEVIYQRGQFTTVKYLSNPYVLPGEAEDDAISEVLRETETTLPSTDYVFFSRGKSNGRAFIKINHHWFSR